MRVSIIAVGRLKNGAEKDLTERYLKRLNPSPQLREVDERRNLSGAGLKRREAALLLDACPEKAILIALDEHGTHLGSRELAVKLRDFADDGVADLAFLIGGADGLDKSVIEKADLTLSLGKMTWPHQLARAMLLEQIYRAQQIIAGHPYHRD